VRIISGKYKGKHIQPPRNFRARPTTDFARVALFNILANYFDFEEISVLDLFAGTGVIGYEFASRGCHNLTSVENHPVHAAFIRRMIRELSFEGFRLMERDVFSFLEHHQTKYDVIFCDPPYDMEGIGNLPDIILQHGLLNKEGILVVEHSGDISFAGHPGFFDERRYGKVHFSFFRVPE